MADSQEPWDSEPDRTAEGSRPDPSEDAGDSVLGAKPSDESDHSPLDQPRGVVESSEAADGEGDKLGEEEASFLEEVENEEPQSDTRSEEGRETEPTAEELPGGDFRDDESQSDRGSFRAERDLYHAGRYISQAGRDSFNAETINIGAEERLSFGAVAETALLRAKRLFVPPPSYEHALQAVRSPERSRVVLIHGPDHSGKWTCALNLAQDVASGASPGNIVEYFRPLSSEIPLVSAISSAELPPGTVVLLTDCFERNVRREELEAARAQSLSAVLVDKKIDLILTGEIDRAQLASLGVVALAAQITERGLTEVFEKNLDYLEEQGNFLLSRRQFAAIRNQWSKLRPTLSTPFYIHQFCSKLVEIDWESLGDRSPARALAQKAREVALGGTQAAREWFDGLHPNEKFLALLVYLFEGAERRWLEDLSRHLVERFRDGGLAAWFTDPRQHGLEDARERIHAIERGGRLELEDRTYERELRRQAENRQHLLWEALELVSPLEPREQWRDGRHRQALGVALGRLGLHDRGHLAETLREMATDRDWARAVVPGYALQEVVRQDPDSMREVVFGLLRSWIRSRDPRLMWAAGAGLWRVYLAGRNVDDNERARAIKTGALDLLRLLAMNLASFDPPNEGRPDGQRGVAERGERGGGAAGLKKKFFGANLWCVVDALRQITLTDPQNAVAELAAWMRSGKASLMGAGRRAARAVYEVFATGKTPSEAQRVPFLGLIRPLLEKASDQSHDVEAVFLILRSWLRSPGVAERARGELISLATFAGRQVRERLRGVLTRLWLDPRPAGAKAAARKMVETKRGKGGRPKAQVEKEAAALARLWCHGTEEEAHAIAQAVVVRCYAIDGALPNLPGMGSGIAVVDPAVLLPTGDAKAEPAASAVWRLLALLESRMDLTVLRLGQTECVALDDALAATELLPRFPTQRLVLPGIEALRRSSKRGAAGEQVFMLAVRKPLDLDDLSAQPWLRSLHYLGPAQGEESSEIEQVNGSVHLDLSWPPSPDEIEKTVTILENGWARALTAATPEDWSELVQTFGFSHLDPVACITLLESNARELDDSGKTARRLDDPVWRSLVLALWWAATDFEACLRWIASWLSLPDKPPHARPEQVIAQTAACALIRLYTAYPPDGSSAGRPPTLLFDVLARPLGLRGPDGVDAVVRLLEHWLADTAWADYLAGDVREGAGRLERWVAEFLVDRPELAARLAERLAEVRPDADISQSWAALAAVVDRLEALRALEHPRCLPALEPGQLHALLVLDAGAGDEHLRRHRAAVAAELHQSLAGEGWGLVPAIYRLGERRPFWAGTAEAPAPERLAPRGMHPSGLIGPLLLALEAQREQVAITLLLTDSAPVDLDDWCESAWWSKVKLYCAGSCSSVASFSTLPQPLSVALAPGGAAPAQTEAGHIAAYLREQFGPNPPVTTTEHIPDGESTAS